MKYWWVNQKQTFKQEFEGGYIWSPKFQSNGSNHFSYDFMRQVQRGDVIFSYAKSTVLAVGVAKSHCFSFPRPEAFGQVGQQWGKEGWKVNISYRKLIQPIRTIDHINILRNHLPSKYSPIKSANGKGNQAYLFNISKNFALALAQLIDGQTLALVKGNYVAESIDQSYSVDADIAVWEDRIESEILASDSIVQTEKETIIKARKGQGEFRSKLLAQESKCRVTGVTAPEHLIASHIKPWRSCDNQERLNPNNGFMLTPSIDHLFDKGFITFEDNGNIVPASIADDSSLKKMGLDIRARPNAGNFNDEQKYFLNYHREQVFLA